LKIGGDIYQKGLSSELLKNIKNVLQQNKLVIFSKILGTFFSRTSLLLFTVAETR